MLGLYTRAIARRHTRFPHGRTFSSPPPSSSARNPENNSIEYLKESNNSQHIHPPPPIIHQPTFPLSPISSSRFSRPALFALSAALVSGVALISLTLIEEGDDKSSNRMYANLEHALDHATNSAHKIVDRMKQTGVAASVLWKSLTSVLSSANHEVRSGFEFRVASLLADIAAANESRRVAIVAAGGGAVVDWLVEVVARMGVNRGTQAEAARALAYLIADPNVCGAVFERPHAVPNILRFIFSTQPSKKQRRRSSFDVSDSLKGRSMLVTAIMDIVTSNCDSADRVAFKPSLPKNAEMRDIAAAIEVVEEGGLHLDDAHGSDEDEDGGKGIKGIGIKVLGGTSVIGLARSNDRVELMHSDISHLESIKNVPETLLFNKTADGSLSQASMSSAAVPGLWDDLHSQHIAVPFAAWALANWATASEVNRSHIQELDRDGQAVMAALIAPERSVKWHGSLVARLLLEDQSLPLNDSVSDWCSSLLSTVSQASKTEDVPLTQMALSAFLVSIERSSGAQKLVMEKGLYQMREIVKRTTKHGPTQEALAKALEFLCTGDMHLSLEESQKWSAILLSWVFDKQSPDAMRSSAINILSRILEDYGPSSVPISQGWLTILLTDILGSHKSRSPKGNTQQKNNKVKTQIDQSNINAATQIGGQLAGSVVNLAVNQMANATDSDDNSPLADLLFLEPFVGPFKSLKKDNLPKNSAADSAVATLKGIKALADISADDVLCQNRLADFGVLCLLRRLLLRDDYEKLAANETYDASRAMEAQEHINVPDGSSVANTDNSSSVRVPPTAHIRRHSARLLTILSVLPKVQKVILEDETWRNWLEECANGNIPGCSDLKTQSYARAILLNISCTNQIGRDPVDDSIPPSKHSCSQFTDMIFLINPKMPHWKCQEKADFKTPAEKPNSRLLHDGSSANKKDVSLSKVAAENGLSTSADGRESCSDSDVTSMDVVFVHGIQGGPFKSWRLSEDKSSTKSGLVEKIDEEAGKHGTFWPGEWLSYDFPHARMFTLAYKTNLTQWSGASLPLQEVSAMLLEKLMAAGIGNHPVVFVTHSMGGLVVKQILHQAKAENKYNLVKNTVGIVFYSCPHFGSRLADMPWRMGLVFRPAPTIGELRSGSPRLIELNNFIRQLHKKGALDVLSFCETKVTPIVEGYGGWAFRVEIVPIESAYPGFGELVVLESTDHVNSCKPVTKTDPSYRETLDFMHKLKKHIRRTPTNQNV